MKIIFKGFDQL